MGLHQTNKKFCRAKETINKMKGNLQFGRKYLLTIYWIKLSEMCLYSWILSVFVNFSLPSFLFSFPFFPPSQPSNLSSSLFSFLSFFLASLLLKGDVGKTGECGSISHGMTRFVHNPPRLPKVVCLDKVLDLNFLSLISKMWAWRQLYLQS